MSKLDRYLASREKLNDPATADNQAIRLAIVKRMNAGEITLAQAQEELRQIKHAARKAGKPVWGGR